MEEKDTFENGLAKADDQPEGAPKEVIISRLDSWSVHRICSGQVIISLAVAIKELVENALDAGAKEVIVRTRDFGAKSIEVQDNGEGILPENFASLCLKHFTSKLRDFGDLESIGTFGFRGEALSSLCALGQVSVVTKHTSREVGSTLSFNTEGVLVQNRPCARQTGTTVCVENIFSALPVRHKQFLNSLKKEFSKMVHFMSGYALIARGVSLSVVNFDDKGRRNEVLRKRAHLSYKENIAEVFGYKEVSKLMDYQPAPLPLEEELLEEFRLTKLGIEYFEEVAIEGLISSCTHGKGRSTGYRQFLFVNSRPCDHAKLIKLINQVYHQYNNSQQPFVMLNILTPQQLVDVNLTPDKRTILLHRENVMLAMIKASLTAMYNKQATQYGVNSIDCSRQDQSGCSFQKQTPSSPDCSFESANPSGLDGGAAEGDSMGEPGEGPLERRPKPGNVRFPSMRSPQDSGRTPAARLIYSSVKTEQSEPPKEDLSCQNPKSFRERFAFQSISTKRKLQDSQVSSAACRPKRMPADVDVPALSSFGFTRSLGKARESLNSEVNQKPSRLDMLLKNCRRVDAVDSVDSGSGNGNGSSKISPGRANVGTETTCDARGTSENTNKMDEIETNVDSSKITKPDNRNSTEGNSERTPGQLGGSAKFEVLPGEDGSSLEAELTAEMKPDCIIDVDVSTSDGEFQADDFTQVDDVVRRKVGVCRLDWTMESLREDFDVVLRQETGAGDETSVDLRFRARISPRENDSAESELTREISKEMFEKMEIIGQFNKGFIIARLRSDLFIVDQHAADEKFNFETLQATTSIDCQPLAVPQKLPLAPGNEQTILEHLPIFEKNGFRFSIDENAAWGHRLSLTAVPQSGHWQMGMAEVDELIFMLNDNSHPNLVNCRPAKVRSMFAMRACRRSVMVGDQLSSRDMKRVVSQLSGLQHPWNCPHGRPTMRHLVNLHLVNI